MAKRNNTVMFRGNLEVDTMEITEETKDGVFIYDLLAELRRFDGKCVSLIIKEELPVQPKR